ncbi:MAG: hypothetical protein LDL47_05420 [Cyanobacteria bacterium KgW148]|nr:hypothetical protein [Cyanobacteria bacterium KgW148]
MIDQRKFELLSSYLDGEVTATERSQVEEWIATDRDFALCYQQQLKLQKMWQVPVRNQIAESSFNSTWDYIQMQQRQRWIGRGIALLGLGILGVGGLLFSQRYSWQQAQEEPIIMALEQPLLPMPKGVLQD